MQQLTITTVTIWIPKSDLENFVNLHNNLSTTRSRDVVSDYKKTYPVTIYTEKMHIDCLQINVSLDLFLKLQTK